MSASYLLNRNSRGPTGPKAQRIGWTYFLFVFFLFICSLSYIEWEVCSAGNIVKTLESQSKSMLYPNVFNERKFMNSFIFWANVNGSFFISNERYFLNAVILKCCERRSFIVHAAFSCCAVPCRDAQLLSSFLYPLWSGVCAGCVRVCALHRFPIQLMCARKSLSLSPYVPKIVDLQAHIASHPLHTVSLQICCFLSRKLERTVACPSQ